MSTKKFNVNALTDAFENLTVGTGRVTAKEADELADLFGSIITNKRASDALNSTFKAAGIEKSNKIMDGLAFGAVTRKQKEIEGLVSGHNSRTKEILKLTPKTGRVTRSMLKSATELLVKIKEEPMDIDEIKQEWDHMDIDGQTKSKRQRTKKGGAPLKSIKGGSCGDNEEQEGGKSLINKKGGASLKSIKGGSCGDNEEQEGGKSLIDKKGGSVPHVPKKGGKFGLDLIKKLTGK
jgi:hypothetical protein